MPAPKPSVSYAGKTNMGASLLRKVWVLLLGLGLAAGQNSPEAYVQASNGAGSLFAYLASPVITQSNAVPLSAPAASATVSSAPVDTAAPPSPTRNPEAETQTVPVGDTAPSSSPSPVPTLANRVGNRARTTRYGVGSQAVAASDQNFDLRLTNERLTTESENLLDQLQAAQSKLEQYRQLQTRETDQYASEESALRSNISETNVTNEALEAQIVNLTALYEDSRTRLTAYQESLDTAQLESAQLENSTSSLQSLFNSVQTEVERIRIIQGAAAGYPLAEPRSAALSSENPFGYEEEVPVRPTVDIAGRVTANGIGEPIEITTGQNETYRLVRLRTGSGSNDDNGDDLEASTDMVYIVALALVFLLLSTLRVWLGHHIDSYLSPTLYTLFFDISLLALLAIVTGILNHMDWFDRDKIDLEKIMYGLGVFIVFWFLLGLWLVLSAQSMARRWFKAESECVDLRRVSQNYEDAYLEYNAEDGPRTSLRVYSTAQSAMQYAVMRQEFICPTYLPYTTEMFLRNDFNLAEYLAKCLAEAVERGMQLSGIGFAVLIICVGTWRLVIYFGFKTELTLFIVIPIVCILLCLLVLEKLKFVYFQLVPEVLDPHEIHLPADNFSRNPMMNVDKVPIPPYLTGSLEYLQSADNPYTCCGVSTNPLKLTCAYIFIGKFPNRHELLYWFDSYGPQFLLGLLQGVALILTFWMVVILIYYVPMLFEELAVWGIMAAVAAVLVWMFEAMYLLPEGLRYLTLTSKIEQMKDRKKVDEVVISSRSQRALKTVQLYRQIKLIYREMSRDEGKADFQGDTALPETMEQHIQEVFNLTCDPATQLLEIPQLSDALELCGIKASNDELRVFIWETDAVLFT